MSSVRVVYIGGVAHNGSTFLGVALGNHPEMICVGELSTLPREGWSGTHLCSCGMGVAECSFWGKVRTLWERKVGEDISTLVQLEKTFDRHRCLPRVMIEKHHRSSLFSKYNDYMYELFEIIRRVSGRQIIVDTSKRFSRALALSLSQDIDLRLIHLLRDARGVAYSWGKSSRSLSRNWYDSSLRWDITNTAFELVKRNMPKNKIVQVRYEDFVTKSLEVLSQIGNFIDVDLDVIQQQIACGDPFVVDHIGIGNGFLVRHKEIYLRSDFEWKQKMPIDRQRRILFLTSWLMRYYGYLLWGWFKNRVTLSVS